MTCPDDQAKSLGAIKALGLTSGGLDSLLALALVRSLGVEVEAFTFVSPFLRAEAARRGVAQLGLDLRVVDFTDEQIEVVKNPRYGRGANMNPCLDCHTLMVRLAERIRKEEGFHFIFTGEVLGQRPMSQTRRGLDLVAHASGVEERLLRPLSAQRLTPTLPEREGWIDREKLLGLTGRGRKPQMALAGELGLTDYPTPAGGCPLTEPQFSHRLKRLLERHPAAGPREMELLRLGRHFELGGRVVLILGRKKAENERLASLIGPDDTGLQAVGPPGPLGLIPAPAELSDEQVELAGRILLAYSDAAGPTGQVRISAGGAIRLIDLPVEDKGIFKDYMIV